MAEKDGKTEKPTPKKIKDARKEGQFPRTPDAATWAMLAVGVAVLPLSVKLTWTQALEIFHMWPAVIDDPEPARALQVLTKMPIAILTGAAPVCLAALLAAILATAAQGVYPSTKVLKPKFSRMNPKEGIKRMFGPKAAWEGLKALLKVTVIAIVVIMIGKNLVPQIAATGTLPLLATVNKAWNGMRTMVWAAAVAGIALAAADYFYQRHTVMKNLMMSLKEVKDEYKQSEGDPMLKSAIRQKQIAMSRNRMMAHVAKANVVLVNPTHLSIALKYTPGAGAPKVVAKGAGQVALKIRELARESRVPVVEDKPLARTIYRVCEIDDEIPEELYLAVARILAFVMAAGRPGKRATTRKPPSHTAVPMPEMPTRAKLRRRRAQEVRAARHL